MHLYILRHGIAVSRSDPLCPEDPKRFLTEEGIARTEKAVTGLLALNVQPEVIITSPFVRARETAEIFARLAGIPQDTIRQSRSLEPSCHPRDILDEISKRGAQSCLVTGHAPHLDHLIAFALSLPRPVTRLKKAGAACLELQSLVKPSGQLLWVMPPKALRGLAKSKLEK